jgi:hypothetical protein
VIHLLTSDDVFCVLQQSTRAYEHPGFVLRLILDGSAIRYEPEFNDFEVVFLNVYDIILKSVGVVPRVETKLYSDWVRPPTTVIFCRLIQQLNVLLQLDLLKRPRSRQFDA